MPDNRFKDYPIDNRFPSPGVDARFATPGVDLEQLLDGTDTRFEGSSYGGDTTPPTILSAVASGGGIEVGINEPSDLFMLRNASATLLSGTTVLAGYEANWTGLSIGENPLLIDESAWPPGTHQLHFAARDAAGNVTPIASVVEWVKAARPQYVGGKVVAFAGTVTDPAAISLTDLTGGLASAPAENDLVVIAYAIGGATDIDITITTADYIEIADIRANDVYDANLGVFRKFMGSTPDTSVTVGPTTNANNAGAVAISVWRGVNLTTPLDVAAVTATGIDTGRPSPGAITPTTAESVIIVAGAAAHATGAVFTSSDLSNFITITSADVNDGTVGIGSFDWTSGTFTPATWGGSTTSTDDSWAAVTLALRPA